MIAFGVLVAGWFAWRAWISPVAELGQADLLLLTGVAGAFISIRAIEGNELAERMLSWGIALLLLANLVVIGKQLGDPTFTPVFESRAADKMISGFFAHYNEAANYLIASSMLVGAAAWFGRHALATRLLWILIAVAGLAGVWLTHSRGGILGAAVGCGVFAAVALMIGKRRGARWFPYALIAIPVIGLAICSFLWMGWHDAQEIRRAGSGIDQLLDNNCRLYFLGIAVSCVALHPFSGGGSRSFGWECFRFVDAKSHGDIITHNPELIHNELVQAVTDYGLIGAGLLIGLLGTLVVVSVVRILFPESSREADSGDAWRLGGLAALAGMFVQSCFSFVFHLLPGILLLGICLGKMSRSSVNRDNSSRWIGSKVLISAAALACVMILFPAGWKGTRVTGILWPSYFSKVP
ncbi:MAG TPA: O-antigen ligase family protein, partial [Luteolibacter sp.]